MDRATSVKIIEILRSTLLQLENVHEDPAVLELKRSIRLTIAELDIITALLRLEEMAAASQQPLEFRNENEAWAA